METIIWLYDVQGERNKFDLISFDKLGRVSANMFDKEMSQLFPFWEQLKLPAEDGLSSPEPKAKANYVAVY